MTNRDFSDPRPTEQRNPRTERIDVASSLEIVDLMNGEDATVAGIVRGERERIARAIDLIVDAIRNGGRVVYVGAGTSGRLGGLDAAECPPTFGVPTRDVVIGIAASGTTPYVRMALGRAQTIGASTVLVTCGNPPKVLSETCDVVINPVTGPEALTGSTTKLVLNTLTTGAMLRLGKAYGNMMVDLMDLSVKLHDRGERIVMECCGVSREEARAAIDRAEGSVKLAIVMLKTRVDVETARKQLEKAGGFVRPVVGDPPAVQR